MSGSRVVAIDLVIPDTDPSKRDIRIMADVLNKQGQIEPLQVRTYSPEKFITCYQDAHGSSIVRAAQLLGWKTLLILEVNKYIY